MTPIVLFISSDEPKTDEAGNIDLKNYPDPINITVVNDPNNSSNLEVISSHPSKLFTESSGDKYGTPSTTNVFHVTDVVRCRQSGEEAQQGGA